MININLTTIGRILIASISINCELRVFLRFAINRFANINMHAYYNTVWGSSIAIMGFAIWPDLTIMQ